MKAIKIHLSCLSLCCTLFSSYLSANMAPQLHETQAMKPLLPKKAITSATALATTPFNAPSGALTLKQAVLYGMAHNNNLQVAEITHQINHSSLVQAKAAFEPVFSLSPSASINQSKSTGSPSTVQTSLNLGPSMTWKLPTGTNISANIGYSPSKINNGEPWQTKDISWGVTLSQPLLQNFGTAVNEASLKEAENSAAKAKITLHTTIASTLTKIIHDYYALLSAQQSFDLSHSTLKSARHRTFKDKHLFTYGRIPKIDLIQAQLDEATAKQSVTQSQQSLQTAKQTLLNTLNLPWHTPITVQGKLALTPFKMSTSEAMALALKNNNDYLNALITIQNDKLSLIKAKNAMRWQLNLKASTSQSIQNAEAASAIGAPVGNDFTVNNSVSLDLNIPFSQTGNKAALESAQLQSMQAKIKLKHLKNTMRSHIQDTLENLKLKWENIALSKEKFNLAQKTDQAAKIKLQYGKTTPFEYSQEHKQYIQAAQAVLKSKVTYLESVAQLEQYLGILLKRWQIHVKMPHWNVL